MAHKLEFKNISKSFPGVMALNNVGFTVEGGEVLALVGENGAGKSTLLKILNGDYQPTTGKYLLDGIEEHFSNPFEAIEAGVGLIYQERQLFDELSVAENIFVGRLPHKNGRVNFSELIKKAHSLIDEFGLPIKPTAKVKDLSVAMQQMVEIMKVYSRKPKVIAFDEPTACLSDKEVGVLYKLIEKLRNQGLIVIYVSHRLNEVFKLSDKIVVLKDGNFVACHNTKDTDEITLVNQMVGRPVKDIFNEFIRKPVGDEIVLSVKNISNKSFKDISFDLKKGEILGFFGLVGAGRTEVMRAIYGADPIDSGWVELDGSVQKIRSPEDAISLGIAFCSEDRKSQGIISLSSIKDNMSIAILKNFCRGIFIKEREEERFALENVQKFNVKASSIKQKISQLSGGNQQKVLLARGMAMNPKILILDEPTKGIDVGAKSEIYKMILDIANKGVSVLLVSSELPEVIGLSDNIIVMRNRRIVGRISRESASEERVLQYAMLDRVEDVG